MLNSRIMKIKKNDTVKVIAGKDRGTTGKVVKVYPKESRAVIEGVNVVKKHAKPRQSGEKGQIIEKSLPIHISNVMLLDPKDNKPTRVGFQVKDGKKVRVAKRSGQVLG